MQVQLHLCKWNLVPEAVWLQAWNQVDMEVGASIKQAVVASYGHAVNCQCLTEFLSQKDFQVWQFIANSRRDLAERVIVFLADNQQMPCLDRVNIPDDLEVFRLVENIFFFELVAKNAGHVFSPRLAEKEIT